MNASALRSRRGAGGETTKSALHCAECGHESPPDGDWNRREEPARTVYVCPACETTLTVRPKF